MLGPVQQLQKLRPAEMMRVFTTHMKATNRSNGIATAIDDQGNVKSTRRRSRSDAKGSTVTGKVAAHVSHARGRKTIAPAAPLQDADDAKNFAALAKAHNAQPVDYNDDDAGAAAMAALGELLASDPDSYVGEDADDSSLDFDPVGVTDDAD